MKKMFLHLKCFSYSKNIVPVETVLALATNLLIK